MSALPAIAGSITFQQGALLITVVVLAIVVWWSWGGRRGMGGSPRQYRREIDSATAQGENVKRDMEQLLAELEDLSAKINGQVDGSFGKLQQLVTEADRRIQAMRILIAECRRLAAEVEAAPTAMANEARRHSAELSGSAASAPASPEQPEQAAVTEEKEETATEAVAAAEPPPENRHERIYQLADKGLTAVQIAQELHVHPGEVELILCLRRIGRE